MSQYPAYTASRPQASGRRPELHRAIEMLLAYHRDAAIRNIDPALDRELIRAVADVAAYYFGETGRMRLQFTDIGPGGRRTPEKAAVKFLSDNGSSPAQPAHSP